MICIERVSKFYKPDIVALKDLTFNIDTGEFLFIVGPSGAGKSTIIRLIIRQELPSEGSIMFDDTNVIKLNRSLLPYYRQQIGVVFQDYKLIEIKTVRENLEFALEITGKTDKEIQETTNSLLEAVNLSKRDHLFPSQLSGGEKQRAGIARALANDPKLLIADEPTGNLDPKTSVEIMSILQTINNWGTTVLIATHDKEIVDQLKRRVVRLEGGTIVSDHIGGYDGGTPLDRTCPPAEVQTQAQTPTQTPSETPSQPSTQSPAPDAPPATASPTATAPTAPAQPKQAPPIGIEKLNLSKDIISKLKENNIQTIDALLDMNETELEALKGIGKKKASQIISALETYISTPQNEKQPK